MKQILKRLKIFQKMKTFSKNLLTYKRKNISYTAFILVIFMITFSVLASHYITKNVSSTPKRYISNGSTVSDAELRFTERSNNSSIKGSVMPASCGSYPGFGTPHDSTGTDGYGHCSGTCPSGSTLSSDIQKVCAYNIPIDYGDGNVIPTLYYSTIRYGSGSICPANESDEVINGLQAMFPSQPRSVIISFFLPQTIANSGNIVTNICRTTCIDSSVVYPHLGQACPVPPPTANINFN